MKKPLRLRFISKTFLLGLLLLGTLRVAAQTIPTAAGSDSKGDGGQATSASLFFPAGVSVDASGNLFIADKGNHRIRIVSPSGVITTYAGNGTNSFGDDGGQAARLVRRV